MKRFYPTHTAKRKAVVVAENMGGQIRRICWIRTQLAYHVRPVGEVRDSNDEYYLLDESEVNRIYDELPMKHRHPTEIPRCARK